MAAAADALSHGLTELQTLTRLRREWPAPMARAAFIILQTSRRALASKFKLLQSRVPLFYAVPEALEQATPLSAALHKAAVLAKAAGPDAMAVDIGCGIGGDAIALAGQFPLLAVDVSPVRSWMTHRNLQALSRRHLVVQADVTQHVWRLPRSVVMHADPARRSSGRRNRQQYFPSIEQVMAAVGNCALAAVKLSPTADFTSLPDAPLEIIAVDEQVIEATLWLGHKRDTLQIGKRTATLICDDLKWRLTGAPATMAGATGKLERFLFETAGAVTRAGLAPNLLEAAGLIPVSRDACYATGSQLIEHPALRAFEVVAAGPFDETRLRRMLVGLPNDTNVTSRPQLEIKTRGGLGLDTDVLHRRLAPYTTQNISVIIYPSQQGVVAAVTRRVTAGRWNRDRWNNTQFLRPHSPELGVISPVEKI